MTFPYDADDIAAVRETLSPERFQRYLDATGGDDIEAVRLYVWNTAASGAFYGPLQACEVTLRNGVHGLLSQQFGGAWFHNAAVLKAPELRMADEAAAVVKRRNDGNAVTPGRVVAELGFGFWTGLFAKAYDERLWRPYLHRLFRPTPDRRDLFDRLDRLRTLRNRIAHHEPIHQRNLMDDWHRVDSLLELMSPRVASWVRYHSRVADVLAVSAADVDRF